MHGPMAFVSSSAMASPSLVELSIALFSLDKIFMRVLSLFFFLHLSLRLVRLAPDCC